MKAVVVADPGGYDKLVITEVADPQPGTDKVVVSVSIAGCNWGDTQMRSGRLRSSGNCHRARIGRTRN
jgi:NADPH:quinone reductase-like Zn-dependent oxidoreductase